MYNQQCELGIIRSCAGICKINHALRTSPTNFMKVGTNPIWIISECNIAPVAYLSSVS